jgi:hypothetical protein
MEAFIYHITPTELGSERVDFDCNQSFVVFAPDSKQARKLASQCRGDEGPETWLRPELSKCRKLGYIHETQSRKPRVVVRNFLAG